MPTRYLKESICTSDNLAAISGDAERCFWRLVVLADDFGRFDGRLAVIRGKGFSLMLDRVSEKDIARWLTELTKAGLIFTYTVNSRPYVQIITLTEHNHPRAQNSKYPQPPEDAGNRMQLHTDADNCPQPLTSVTESESESESESLADKPPADRRNGHSKSKPEPQTNPNYQPMFDALCQLTKLDPKLRATAIGKTANHLLGAGYTAESVAALATWWRRNDWRGQKGQAPTLPQVEDNIGKCKPPPVTPDRDDYDADLATRAIRDARKAAV